VKVLRMIKLVITLHFILIVVSVIFPYNCVALSKVNWQNGGIISFG
jgi:hypothetical protein